MCGNQLAELDCHQLSSAQLLKPCFDEEGLHRADALLWLLDLKEMGSAGDGLVFDAGFRR
jgi:hypothetical protein